MGLKDTGCNNIILGNNSLTCILPDGSHYETTGGMRPISRLAEDIWSKKIQTEDIVFELPENESK